jgi:hypothetical protein
MTSRTVGLLSLLALSNAGCGGDDNAGQNGGADAGTDVGSGVDAGADAGPRVSDHGKVIDYDTKKGLAGVTVTEGDATAVTAADGTFTITPLANTPVTLKFRKDGFTQLDWPEVMLSGDAERGNVAAVSLDTFHLGSGALDGYDSALGVLYVTVKASASCAGVAGTKVEVASPAGATVRYVVHGLPSKSQTSAAAGEDPVAAAYNLQNNVPITLALTHPTCKQAAFPHTEGTITYTGNITTEGGDGNSYVITFIE